MLHYNIIFNKDNPYDTELIVYNNNEIIYKGMDYQFISTVIDENEEKLVVNLNYGSNYRVPVQLKKIGNYIITIPLISIDTDFEKNHNWLEENIYDYYHHVPPEFDNYVAAYEFSPIFWDINTVCALWLDLGFDEKEVLGVSPLLYSDLKNIWLSKLANEVNWDKKLLISNILSDENNSDAIERAKTLISEKWCNKVISPNKFITNDNHKVYSIYLDMPTWKWDLFSSDNGTIFYPKLGNYSLNLH